MFLAKLRERLLAIVIQMEEQERIRDGVHRHVPQSRHPVDELPLERHLLQLVEDRVVLPPDLLPRVVIREVLVEPVPGADLGGRSGPLRLRPSSLLQHPR